MVLVSEVLVLGPLVSVGQPEGRTGAWGLEVLVCRPWVWGEGGHTGDLGLEVLVYQPGVWGAGGYTGAVGKTVRQAPIRRTGPVCPSGCLGCSSVGCLGSPGQRCPHGCDSGCQRQSPGWLLEDCWTQCLTVQACNMVCPLKERHSWKYQILGC